MDGLASGSLKRFSEYFGGEAGFAVIEEKVEQSKINLRTFKLFMFERAQIEEQYSKRLSALLKKTAKLVEYGTTREAWHAIRTEVETSIGIHQRLSVKLMNEVTVPVKKFKDDMKKTAKPVVNDTSKVKKELKELQDQLKKLKQKHIKTTREADRLDVQIGSAQRNPKTSEQQVAKLRTRLSELEQKAIQTEEDYRYQIKKITDFQPKWAEKMSRILDTIQQRETERLRFMKNFFRKYVEVMREGNAISEPEAQKLFQKLDLVEPSYDIERFIAERQTGRLQFTVPVFDLTPYHSRTH